MQTWILAFGAAVGSFILSMAVRTAQFYITHSGNERNSSSVANFYNAFGAIVYSLITIVYVRFVYAPWHALLRLPFDLPFFLVLLGFPGTSMLEKVLSVSTVLLGYVGAFLRLIIAALFVASYVTLPHRQRILQLLYPLVGNAKPTFAILFGLLGAWIVLLEGFLILLD
jgi:hypothetical protein